MIPDRLPRLRRDGNIFEHSRLIIAEADIAELDAALGLFLLLVRYVRVLAVFHVAARIVELHNLLCGGEEALTVVDDNADEAHRFVNQPV